MWGLVSRQPVCNKPRIVADLYVPAAKKDETIGPVIQAKD